MHSLGLDYINHACTFAEVGQAGVGVSARVAGWGGGEGEITRQNSELYYTRIKILGSCLFLQSAPANLHAKRLHMKQS